MSNKNYHLYQVVGRKAPYTIGDKDVPNPPAFRIKIFARDELQAKSRFWYFMHQMRKMKKTTGEILDVSEITEKNTRAVSNYGIWLKYNSRSGTHNMYREYRDTSLCGAIGTMYDDMAGRHRTRNKSIQIIKTATVATKDCKRENVMQMHGADLKFPMPHRQLRCEKAHKSDFAIMNARTHFN